MKIALEEPEVLARGFGAGFAMPVASGIVFSTAQTGPQTLSRISVTPSSGLLSWIRRGGEQDETVSAGSFLCLENWSFKDGRTIFGDMWPDTSQPAKFMLMEFGLVFANRARSLSRPWAQVQRFRLVPEIISRASGIAFLPLILAESLQAHESFHFFDFIGRGCCLNTAQMKKSAAREAFTTLSAGKRQRATILEACHNTYCNICLGMYVPRGGVDQNDRNVLAVVGVWLHSLPMGDTASAEAIAVFPPGKVRMPAFLSSISFALGDLNWINLGNLKTWS